MLGWWNIRFRYDGQPAGSYWGVAEGPDELGAFDAAIRAYMDDHQEADLDLLECWGGYAGKIRPFPADDELMFDARL